MPKRECSYRQVLCATIAGKAEGGLRASGRGKAKGRSKVDCGNSDPMIEAGAPSTGKSLACVTKCCARPTGVVMVAPQTVPRNAEGRNAKAAPWEDGRGVSIISYTRRPFLNRRLVPSCGIYGASSG